MRLRKTSVTMKYFLGLFFLLGHSAKGQISVIFQVMDEDTRLQVAGASAALINSGKGWVSDSVGRIRVDELGAGNYVFVFSAAGYSTKELRLSIPTRDTVVVLLEPDGEALGEVVVTSTRTFGRVKDLPVRVEVLGSEDMEEETSMHPSNVAMLLSEASGVQTQQTSASSGNVQIKILGLDGKYTQLLKDGFPLYSGFSDGLSIMQIPPLDLKQVELIKGSASALYGGDAIAGIINFVSKTPGARPEWNFLANQTARGGTDMGTFYSARSKHWGVTMLGTFSHQLPVDIHNDGFTVLPRQIDYTVNPRLFWYPSDSARLSLSVNATYDDRTGGDLLAVKNGPTLANPYTEQSRSNRAYYQLEYQQRFEGGRSLTVRNSTSSFDRNMGIMAYRFSGKQTSSFSEVSFLSGWGRHKVVIGANLNADAFVEDRRDSLLRDYHFATVGFFAQDDWALGKRWTLEMGLRYDIQHPYGSFWLPRLSVLYRPAARWSIRLGGGEGYKVPTIFDAQTEETAFKDVLPIGDGSVAERSAGGTLNINYTGTIGEDLRLIADQSFYYTQVRHPLALDTALTGADYYFANANHPYTTRGFETSIRLRQDNWNFFVGYTYVDARTGVAALPIIALVPHSRLVFDLSTEKENNYRIALEAFYTGAQYLYDGSQTRDYWVAGLLLEKTIGLVTLVLNGEDLTGTRQTRWGPVVIPPVTDPTFHEIYAPLEGFLLNLAVKVRIL